MIETSIKPGDLAATGAASTLNEGVIVVRGFGMRMREWTGPHLLAAGEVAIDIMSATRWQSLHKISTNKP